MSSPSTTWKSQAGYVWSLIGSAVGFANVLSFSAQVYKNGGGAYLIPYIVAMLLLGIPMLLLEGMIGYKWKLPVVGAYGHKWGSKGKILGWLAITACMTIGAFYIVLTGYSAAYTFFAASNQIPDDSQTFFVQTFLKSTSSIQQWGQLSFPIFFGTLTVAIVTWFVMVRQVKDGIEKICSWFMPMMAVLIAVFAITVCFLPGGMNGWTYYLKPDVSRLLDPNLWRDVFGQLFFSLSLGLGIIIGYSRHTKQDTNIAQAMVWVAIGDFAVSFFAGFAIFGCLAHISYVQGIPFDQILTSDSTFEIGFVLFPKILKFFGSFSTIIGTLFFFCIFIAGITGVFSIVESIAGNVEIEFQTTRKKAVSWVVGSMMAMATLFCMGNASHLIDALVPMVLGTNMLIGGLALVIAFAYGQSDALWPSKSRNWFIICLKTVAPVVLSVILIGNLWQEAHGIDLAKVVRWGWFVLALSLSGVLVRLTQPKPYEYQSLKSSLSET